METTTAHRVSFHKGDSRYYVRLDGQQVGWVLKGDDGWRFYATVRESLTAELLGVDDTRWLAVYNGLSSLNARHLGRIFRLDTDRESDTYMQDLPVYFEDDRLRATMTAILDRAYGS